MRRALIALATLFALPATASAATYSVDLAAAQPGKVIARDVLWSCAGSNCSGATDYSRPLIVCQSLARKAGRIAAFRVDGRALAAPDLERCNAAAKATPATANGAN